MKAVCTLSIEFKTAEQAHKVLRSVQMDDEGFVSSSVKGKTLEAMIECASVSSLLHTLDDYLACVSVAGGIVRK